MSDLTVVHRAPSVNGTAKRPARKPQHRGRKAMKHARRLACGVGAVGVGVLGLSVAHCTESIGLLTGSHWALSGMLAIGINAGMVVSEPSELASHGTRAERRVRPLVLAYTLVAAILSVLRNACAFGMHAAPGIVWAAWLLGAGGCTSE